MDNRFVSIFLPALVMTREATTLDNLTVDSLYYSYNVYNDYDADRDDVNWKRMRFYHTRVGNRKALVIDYRDREDIFSVYSLITYSADHSLPVRYYTFFADFYDFEHPHTALLRENNGDMTSTHLQRYSFDISWHTMLETVRIHEKNNPLLERNPEEIFPDL